MFEVGQKVVVIEDITKARGEMLKIHTGSVVVGSVLRRDVLTVESVGRDRFKAREHIGLEARNIPYTACRPYDEEIDILKKQSVKL